MTRQFHRRGLRLAGCIAHFLACGYIAGDPTASQRQAAWPACSLQITLIPQVFDPRAATVAAVAPPAVCSVHITYERVGYDMEPLLSILLIAGGGKGRASGH